MENTNKYYEITATIDGQEEILFGSFVRADCVYEKDAEKDGWQDEGYKKIKIVSRETTEAPDAEVYEGEVVTPKQLFMTQAPAFNFELDEAELLEEALERGFVTPIAGKKDLYLINADY